MPIEFFPNDEVKRKKHVVEKLQEPVVLYSVFDSASLAVAPLVATMWFPVSWDVNRVTLHWTTAVAKDFAISVVRGRGIVKGKNDRLFFKVDGVNEQEILLTQGFYTGATLATEIKARLDANATFVGIGAAPFTVTYAPVTGLFSIAANGAMPLEYFRKAVSLRRLDNWSSAGSVVGLTADTGLLASVVSDTAVKNLGVVSDYVSGTASTSQNVFATDVVAMSVDDALRVNMGIAAGTTGDYEAVYSILDW
jgi:hypothetical protein